MTILPRAFRGPSFNTWAREEPNPALSALAI